MHDIGWKVEPSTTLFDQKFFERRQSTLLRLVNSPVLGRDMRQALWLPNDRAPITKITPNAVHEWLGGTKFRATLYSNPQYAEAMHRSFGWIWKTAHAWDALIANSLRPQWNLGFDTYTSQPDETTGIDTYIESVNTTANYGANALFQAGEYNVGTQIFRGLIKFDFSSIPFGALSSSATLSLWLYFDGADNTRIHRFYRQLRDWVELQATWNIWKTSNNWATAGGFGATDCEQTDVASLSINSAEAAGEKQWTNWTLASLNAMFGASPSFTNNGFLLKADTEANDLWAYRSSGYATAGERPKMVIVYSVFIPQAIMI